MEVQQKDRILRTPFFRDLHPFQVRTVFEYLLLIVGAGRTVCIFLTDKIRHPQLVLKFYLFAFSLIFIVETVYGCDYVAVFLLSVVVGQQIVRFACDRYDLRGVVQVDRLLIFDIPGPSIRFSAS